MRIVAAVLLTLLAGCAGSAQTATAPGLAASDAGVTGDQRGGKTHYGPGGLSAAMDAAGAHCRHFGRKALITQMTPSPDGGGQLGFECRGSAS